LAVCRQTLARALASAASAAQIVLSAVLSPRKEYLEAKSIDSKNQDAESTGAPGTSGIAAKANAKITEVTEKAHVTPDDRPVGPAGLRTVASRGCLGNL
jgi:hypothetical protein